MVAPAPGRMPMTSPISEVQIVCHQYAAGDPEAFERVGPARGLGGAEVLGAHNGFLLDHDEGFGDREQSDQRRDQRDAVIELEEAEGGTRRAEHRVDADGADHQPEEAGDQPLEQVLRGDGGDQGEPEHHHHHHLDAAEVEPERGERRQHRHGDDGGDKPAEGRGRKAADQRLLRLPLLGHRVAVERGRDRAAFARHVEQDGGDAAAELRGAIERDHQGHAGLDVHVERDRQQDDQRVLRAEARQDADDGAEHHARQDDPPERERAREQFEQERIAGRPRSALESEQPGDQLLDRAVRQAAGEQVHQQHIDHRAGGECDADAGP